MDSANTTGLRALWRKSRKITFFLMRSNKPLKPAYKPTFDYKRPLEIKTETQKKMKGSDKNISTGDTIAHPAWGQGVVISVEASGQDNIITAAFAGLGIKKFLTGFAQIKKLNDIFGRAVRRFFLMIRKQMKDNTIMQ
jgi:hypothetical protein